MDTSGPHKFDEEVEKRLVTIMMDKEVSVVDTNNKYDNEDFEAFTDLFDAVRTEKEYSWMSDIFIPEFPSHMLTQSSEDVAQYFQTRDFVECYVMDESNEAVASAGAARELINRTLNRRRLHHYQKYVRGKLMSHLSGKVYLHCWWEQDVRRKKVGEEIDPITGEKVQDLYDYDIKKDCFNYDIIDQRNVFAENRYTYSIQDKDWVTIREETSYESLRKQNKSHGYFNLDLVKNLKEEGESESRKKTRHPDEGEQTVENLISPKLDKYTRYGKAWYLNGGPGVNESGEVLEGATLEECVTTWVVSGSSRILIGFHKTPYKDHNGNPYKPLVRGLCYIHPTKDGGAGDGKYARELQIGINDTFNLTNDRTRLATMPTMKVKKYIAEDTDSIYFAPEHAMEVDNPEDIQEFQISSDISGGMTQLAVLTDKMRQVTGTQPPDLGQVPQLASTTATAASLASAGTGKRDNYKSMTYENTALAELYWMIIQMTYAFAKPETGYELMGDKVYAFDPKYEYFFRPLSQSIESEHSKGMKIQRWTQVLGYLINLVPVNPTVVPLINKIIVKIAELDGDEFVNVVGSLVDPRQTQMEQQGGGQGTQATPMIGAPSNQNGVGMGGAEMSARGLA